MKLIFISFFVLVGSIFQKLENLTDGSRKKIIFVQPLGKVDFEYLKIVSQSITSFYGYRCVLLPQIKLSKDLLSKSQKRYDGTKILKKFQTQENILVVTEKDITTKKNNILEWGVLGLGYRPGTVCVISTFRMKKNVSHGKFIDRLKKVSIHEVGHNLGLDHCTNDKTCIMNDAKGKVSIIDKEKIIFCEKCKKQIGMK